MEDILIVTNQQGIIQKINLATLSLLEYSQSNLINHPLSSFVEDDTLLQKYLKESSLKKQDFLFKNLELTCHKKNGEKIILEFSISTLTTDTDDSLDFIYVGRDITARKRAQQRMFTQYQISRILSEAPNIHEALLQILQSTCESWGWVLGEVWMLENFLEAPLVLGEKLTQTNAFIVNYTNPKLECIKLWINSDSDPSEIQGLYQKINPDSNISLPGKIWQSGFAHWIEDVMVNDQLTQKDIAEILGLHAGFGFPIKDGKEVLGIITFWGAEICFTDTELMQTMTTIGSQLGQFMKRKLAETALKYQQQQTETVTFKYSPRSDCRTSKKRTKNHSRTFF